MMTAAAIDAGPTVSAPSGARLPDPSGEDMTWALADLAPVLAGVDVLSVAVHPDEVVAGGWDPVGYRVPFIALTVHVADAADAGMVATALGLPAMQLLDMDVDPNRSWGAWTGWLSDAGREDSEFVVSVRLIARLSANPETATGHDASAVTGV